MESNGPRFPVEVSQNYLDYYNPSGGEIKQLLSEIRKIDHKLPDPTMDSVSKGEHKKVVQHILSNGMTVGEFCIWYLMKRKDD
jgi:hypothetical protein